MKQIVPIVLTALMMASLFAGIDFVDELKDTNEMETGGRAAYELNLHDVLQPRETFVDQAGNTRNGIDVGDIVYFRPIIINDGDNAHDEFNVRVTVTPAGDGQTAVIDNLDDVVCPGTTTVTGCSYNTLAAGDFLGGGNYRIQAESGGDLSWTPSVPGEYTVTISIEVDSSMDSDLTNNDMTYSVTVQHYRDIVVDLCWTDGPGGDCLADEAAYDNVQGTGPHTFALSVTADGSESWAPRATTVTVDFAGAYDTDPMSPSTFDVDGSGPDMPQSATPDGHTFTVVVGDATDVDVWHNMSNLDSPVTDANDLQENPCSNGDNPCQQSRTVMAYQQPYVFHGEIVGDSGTSGASEAPVGFSITAMLHSFDSYEPAAAASGGAGPGGEEEEPSMIMAENTVDYDDRTGNNDGSLSGYFSVFHDIGVTSLTAGDNEATEGTLNVGTTTLTASVVFGGSSGDNSYDWDVTFTVTDENGNSALPGMMESISANECLDDSEDSYSHTLLSETSPGSFPEGTACVDVDMQAGRFTVTATANMISETSDPTDATDMNGGNDVRATFYEVINDNPTIFMTLDEIVRGDETVDAPIIVDDWITMRARGMDTETPDEGLTYSWKRVTAGGEVEDMFQCDQSICTVETDLSWAGERMVTATVTDGNGASASDSMLISVWNSYSHDMTVTGASLSYSLVYGPMVAYNVTAADADAFTQQQLGNNAGAFDSVVAFDLTVSNVMMPADIGSETLTINFDGDATTAWGLWFKRTTDSPWTSVNHVTSAAGASSGTTMTFSHDGGMEGNLGGGTYAIFDAATAGAEPPAAGVSGLTASLAPDARIEVAWGYGDNPQFASADTVNVYWCAWADADTSCDPLTGTSIAGQSPDTMAWTHIGVDATKYTIRVQTENGNTDVVTGAMLTGGHMDTTVTADGSVSPAPSLSNAAATKTSTNDGLTFTWDATGTDDVSAWVVCWAGTQDIVNNEFDSLLGNSCAETEDTTTSGTVTEQDMCGGTCNAELYFGIAGKDAVGNVADPGVDMYADMKEGLEEPGVIDSTDPGAGDDGMPSSAIYAIIGLVVLAVIGGAFILTRGAEADGEDKEWDY